MCDAASLGTADLRARLRDCIERRLDAQNPLERDRAGAALLEVLDEIARRDGERPTQDGHHDAIHDWRSDVRTDSPGLRG